MGVSYDIIELSSNQIVNTFGLKWLSEYTDFNIPKLERQEMIEYCEEQIHNLEEELERCEKSRTLDDLKNNLISQIYPCETYDELEEILKTFLDEKIPNTNEEQINHIKTLIHRFDSFQNFLIPYIWDNYHKYKAEISY